MMEIITKKAKVEAGTLNYGDVFESATGRIYMVVNGAPYIEDDGTVFYKVVLVDLERGTIDRISKDAVVRPVKLVAREE